MLPPLYRYGLEMYSYVYETTLPEERDTDMIGEDEKDNEGKGESEEDSISDIDIANQLDSESDEDEAIRVAKLVNMNFLV